MKYNAATWNNVTIFNRKTDNLIEKRKMINYYEQYKFLAGKMCINVKNYKIIYFYCSCICRYVHNIWFAILAIFKCTIWWQWSHSHCCAALTTNLNGSTVPTLQGRPPRPSLRNLHLTSFLSLNLTTLGPHTSGSYRMCPSGTGSSHSALTCAGMSLPFKAGWRPITHRPFFANLSLCGWTLGLFPPSRFVDNTAKNMGVQTPFRAPAFRFLG